MGCCHHSRDGSKRLMCTTTLQDGMVAVVVLFDSTVTVWDLEKQEPLTVLQRWGQRDAALGHTGGVNAAYVTRDGSRALTVSKDTTARIWDMASGASLHVLEGPHPPSSLSCGRPQDGSAARLRAGRQETVSDHSAR